MTALLALAAFACAYPSFPPERRVLLPFDYNGVRVTGGILKTQLDDAKEFYLRIPNDDLLIGFRKRAGLPAPGRELGGWYSSDTFHIFGQILSGLARLYRATGDPDCKAKADALLDGWAQCIAPDGYFFYSKNPNAPNYIYDKMVGGLVDMALYAGRKDAFKYLAKITAWAEKHLDRTNEYANSGAPGPAEWYTLSENLYRGYLATGDVNYRDFAKVWEYTEYWRLYANGQDLFGKRPGGGQTERYHAYSHVNTLGGAAMAYRVTGRPWYLDTVRNAYDYLQANECFATGGFGPDESLVAKGRLQQMLRNTDASFETQCGTWAVFKLCKNLISITGNARYGDWVEQVAYNGIATTPPMTAEGNVFYYSDYNPFGGVKRQIGTGWTCCAGTRPMAIADVCDLIYFKAPNALCVNLFVPSVGNLTIGGSNVSITETTRFPEDDKVTFTIRLDHPCSFELRVRKPGWLSGRPSATVNGAAVGLGENSENWLVLNRRWKGGDRVSLRLPMELHAVPLYSNKLYPTAIACGPVVLAFRSDKGSPANLINLHHVASSFAQGPGEALIFHLREHPEVLARPFYAYNLGEDYFMYLDQDAPRHINYHLLKTRGPWNDSGNHYYCNQIGAYVEGTFEGDAITVLGFKYDDGGHGEVRVDGKVVGVIDEFAPGRDIPDQWKFAGLGGGRHTIRITVLPEKNPSSKDTYMNIAGLLLAD